ncbi:MAG: succinate dehydrogenase, hydrophobic membrane anchor protein [Acetobacteraceae bacterium]|jgi:succinate dehydrogenase / fumarate reductase membrane anchor subunit
MPDLSNPPHIDMLRSPLGRARGLGSARSGSKHWWGQRLTSIALVPLTLWFIWSMLRLTGASQADVADWLSSPVRMALMLALIFATFHHLQLGLQVVIEDYVPQEGIKLAAVLAVKALCILLALICTVCALILCLSS